MRFTEEVISGLWVPQMVSFMTYQFRRQLVRNIANGDGDQTQHSQRSERINAALASWESSDKPFSNRELDRLFAGAVHQEAASGASPISMYNKARQDFARDIYEACRNPKKTAGRAVSSTHGTWFLVLRGAIQHTSEKDVSAEDWITGLATAMAESSIEWLPGSHRSRLTSRRIFRLVGVTKPRHIMNASPGGLKRQAMEAEYRMQLEAQQPKRRRGRVIDFGYAIPFQTVPAVIQNGFTSLDKLFEKRDPRVLNHYQTARNCLAKQQRKDPEQLAATLVTRMLWYLRRADFPWDKDQRGVLRIKEMVKKIEQKGVSNRMLVELGWITVKGNRTHTHFSDSTLRSEEDLCALRRSLLHARKNPEAFIATVFQSSGARTKFGWTAARPSSGIGSALGACVRSGKGWMAPCSVLLAVPWLAGLVVNASRFSPIKTMRPGLRCTQSPRWPERWDVQKQLNNRNALSLVVRRSGRYHIRQS